MKAGDWGASGGAADSWNAGGNAATTNDNWGGGNDVGNGEFGAFKGEVTTNGGGDGGFTCRGYVSFLHSIICAHTDHSCSCGQEGHKARDCPTNPQAGGGDGKCFNCQQEGQVNHP